MKTPVIIIGGGLVGLNAALQVCQMGMRPVLIEALPTLGGRSADGAAEDIQRITGQLAPFDPLYVTARNMQAAKSRLRTAAWRAASAVGKGSMLVAWARKESQAQ